MDSWQVVAVADLAAASPNALATGPFGSAISSKYFRTSGIPVIRGSNLSDSVGERLIEEDLVFVSEDKAAEFTRSIVRRGDLIFTCWGTVGQVGLIDIRSRFPEYVVSNKQMKLTPDPMRADSLFLYYCFSSPEVSASIKGQAIGSSVPGFNLGQLKNLRLRLPSLVEQRAIAAVLGRLDDKIAINQRTNETLQATARALFRSWFVDFDRVDGRMPQGWSRRPLNEWVNALSGGTPSKSNAALWGGDLPWISPKVMTEIHADEADAFVTASAIGNGTRLAPQGSTLVMVRGMGLHQRVRVSQARREVTFNQDVKALVPRDIEPSLLLFAMLDAQADLLGRVESSGHGTGVLPTEILLSRSIAMPPRDVQKEMAKPFDLLNDRIALAREESRTLAELRDLLLPKLVSGELRVRDAERVVEAVA